MAALSCVEALLAADGAPFSSRLQGARAALLLQLRRWGFPWWGGDWGFPSVLVLLCSLAARRLPQGLVRGMALL